MGKAEMNRGNFAQAFKLLSRVEEGAETDIELLDLCGVCLMNLRHFEEASRKFKRLIALDKSFDKQAYVSLALCESQLGRGK